MQADWLWGISEGWSACVAIRHWQSNLYGFSGWLSRYFSRARPHRLWTRTGGANIARSQIATRGVLVEVMPPNTNRGPAVAGCWVRLGGRSPIEANCRDEVAASLAVLWDRTGQQVFTVREVYAEMLAAGTRYAESTVFKTMQRMKAPAGAAPWIVLEQTGAGFRASTQT
jgi:hypothetical protein